MRSWNKVVCWPIEQPEPDPIPLLELEVPVMSIIVLASVILSLQQSGANFSKELLSGSQHFIHCVCRCAACLVLWNCRWWPAVDYLEWSGFQ
jgi:hypothetical protein